MSDSVSLVLACLTIFVGGAHEMRCDGKLLSLVVVHLIPLDDSALNISIAQKSCAHSGHIHDLIWRLGWHSRFDHQQKYLFILLVSPQNH
jgi:hypothetical protein